MNSTIKSIGEQVLNLCCKSHILQECMRTYCSLYGDYKFVPSSQNVTIQQALMSYHYDDLKKTDTVLDVGAHVGGFSILVSGIANKIYAIEPIYDNELIKNIELNDITNINVQCCGLGEEGIELLEFNGNSKKVECHNLKYIIDTFCEGSVDFLKIDCEDGEWSINPDELDGIRRIEGEIHATDKNFDMFDFINMLKENNYIVDVEKNNGRTMIFHATKTPVVG